MTSTASNVSRVALWRSPRSRSSHSPFRKEHHSSSNKACIFVRLDKEDCRIIQTGSYFDKFNLWQRTAIESMLYWLLWVRNGDDDKKESPSSYLAWLGFTLSSAPKVLQDNTIAHWQWWYKVGHQISYRMTVERLQHHSSLTVCCFQTGNAAIVVSLSNLSSRGQNRAFIRWSRFDPVLTAQNTSSHKDLIRKTHSTKPREMWGITRVTTIVVGTRPKTSSAPYHPMYLLDSCYLTRRQA